MSEESDKDWLKYSGERERPPSDKQKVYCEGSSKGRFHFEGPHALPTELNNPEKVAYVRAHRITRLKNKREERTTGDNSSYGAPES